MEIKFNSCLAAIFNAHYMGCGSWLQSCDKTIHLCGKIFFTLHEMLKPIYKFLFLAKFNDPKRVLFERAVKVISQLFSILGQPMPRSLYDTHLLAQ